MFHHVREIQKRLLVTVVVLLIGMVVGYFFYAPIFQFIKAPLNGPLHYTSPSGTFNLVLEICLMVGAIATIPVAVYNVIMFIQPALKERLSRSRVYTTTLLSLVLALAGAAFAFIIIIPLALQFFFKIQLNGLIALISVSDYLRFVVNIIITFVIMFQIPLLMSLADHIRPLPPKKLFKAEKYVLLAGVIVAIIVPFAVDPSVQLLVASPIVILYNLSIVIILLQQYFRRRRSSHAIDRRQENTAIERVVAYQEDKQPLTRIPVAPVATTQVTRRDSAVPPRVMDVSLRHRNGTTIKQKPAQISQKPVANRTRPLVIHPPTRQNTRLITDMRRTTVKPRSAHSRTIYDGPNLATE